MAVSLFVCGDERKCLLVSLLFNGRNLLILRMDYEMRNYLDLKMMLVSVKRA